MLKEREWHIKNVNLKGDGEEDYKNTGPKDTTQQQIPCLFTTTKNIPSMIFPCNIKNLEIWQFNLWF